MSTTEEQQDEEDEEDEEEEQWFPSGWKIDQYCIHILQLRTNLWKLPSASKQPLFHSSHIMFLDCDQMSHRGMEMSVLTAVILP